MLVRDLHPLEADWDLRFALRVAVPDAVLLTGRDADGVNAWIHDSDRSWAAFTARDDGTVVLFQGGLRRIGDGVLTPGPGGRHSAARTGTTTGSPSFLTPSGRGRAARTARSGWSRGGGRQQGTDPRGADPAAR
ncbi:hypothetical protein [Kitasatospora sp. NPDC089509]|uniref:hypothetical protein n=1 Tax=Kitasatospora sp. NPDC089509 TaxID=3364079 RepID=UPI0038097980